MITMIPLADKKDLPKILADSIVLVVDHSSTIRSFINSILRDELGCQRIHLVSNANDAIRLLKGTTRVDWIFSDWEMPGMSGDELLAWVRSYPPTSDIPFIMVTYRNDKDSLAEAVKKGVTDFLTKPFPAKSLIRKIMRIDEERKRRKNTKKYRASSQYFVEINFPSIAPYQGELVNVSMSDCVVRIPTKKQDSISIYQEADLSIQSIDEVISIKGELIRLEADYQEQNAYEYIIATFQVGSKEVNHSEDKTRQFSRIIEHLEEKLEEERRVFERNEFLGLLEDNKDSDDDSILPTLSLGQQNDDKK